MKHLLKNRTSVPTFAYLLLFLSIVAIIVAARCFHLKLADTLALISLDVVLFIAGVQQIDLTSLNRIAEDTRETAHRIRMDECLAKNVSEFFGISGGDGKRYVCVCPVEFNKKPLPLINAGDFYALQMLNNRLGAERLRFSLFPRRTMADWKSSDAVFICASDANPITTRVFSPHNMPCWIKQDEQGDKYIEVTQANSQPFPVISPSESYFLKAKKLTAEELYDDYKKGQTYVDYGLLARVTDGNRRYLLIAGIHQQGTWVVAAYLDRLLLEERNKTTEMFFEPYDFAAIIGGTFETSLFKHHDVGIYLNHRWQRKNGEWQRRAD